MKRVLILGFVVSAGFANALWLDDFASGPYSGSISSGSTIQQQFGTMRGNQRDLLLTVLQNPYSQQLQQTIGDGLSVTSTGAGLVAIIGLQYDGFDAESVVGSQFNAGPGFSSLDMTDQFIRLGFLSNDRTLTARVELEGNGLSSYDWSIAGNQDDPFNVDVNLNSFVGNANMSGIDRVTIYFYTMPSGDFALGSIQVVPEPLSMSAFAVALVGMGAARRKRKLR